MTDPWGWFISLFMRLLDLASGCSVVCPWIETRNERAQLARRTHIRIGDGRQYVGGYSAIKLACHWSNGDFLTAALCSPEAREPFFLIALRHCVRAGAPSLTLDDQLAHLVRALECLCRRFGFSQQDLREGLSSELKTEINGALKKASQVIKGSAGAVPSARRAQIARIAARVYSATEIDRSFGLAVECLARQFGLLDPDMLLSHYDAHPGPNGRNWIDLLSYYRGAVFHEGFLDIDSSNSPVGDVLGFLLHLHDFLVRILFKIINYQGTYQPRLIRGTAAEDASWFKPGINVAALLRIPTLGVK